MARISERIGSALSQNGYEQVRTVGEGSFGKAILVRPARATACPDDKMAIVKMIDISRATKKEKNDALQESQVLSSLKHPNIVKYRTNFLAEGWLCIVMDYCEGGDLSSRIKKARTSGKKFSEDQVLWWFAQGLQALKYIHDLHILHRDLKSGNFFLSKTGNLKMGDFGIAKVLECTAACAQTQVGTPYYLCPEICKGKPYSWGSDIWAMGIILHEMCALRVPFDGHDLKSLIQRITKAPTPQLPSEYSKELQEILNKLLNRNPSLRPQADEILSIPVVDDVVRRLESRGSEVNAGVAQRRDSEVKQEAEQRPQSAVSSVASHGQYSDLAGSYSKRDKVEYHSETHQEWLPANVTDVDTKGRILMDVKPNTWISVEVQAEKVRLRKPPSDQKVPKRPSTAAAAPRGVAGPPKSARVSDVAGPPKSARVSEQAEKPQRMRRRSDIDVRPSRPEVAARGKLVQGVVRRQSACNGVISRASPRGISPFAARLGA